MSHCLVYSDFILIRIDKQLGKAFVIQTADRFCFNRNLIHQASCQWSKTVDPRYSSCQLRKVMLPANLCRFDSSKQDKYIAKFTVEPTTVLLDRWFLTWVRWVSLRGSAGVNNSKTILPSLNLTFNTQIWKRRVRWKRWWSLQGSIHPIRIRTTVLAIPTADNTFAGGKKLKRMKLNQLPMLVSSNFKALETNWKARWWCSFSRWFTSPYSLMISSSKSAGLELMTAKQWTKLVLRGDVLSRINLALCSLWSLLPPAISVAEVSRKRRVWLSRDDSHVQIKTIIELGRMGIVVQTTPTIFTKRMKR